MIVYEKEAQPWLYREFEHIGLDYNDFEVVNSYNERQRIVAEREKELLQQLGVSSNDTLIEFGSGTGLFAIEAAKLCRKVYAVDVSDTMIAFMQSWAASQAVFNIDYAHAGFLSYQHRGKPVDVVVSKNALHHLPDFWKVQALERIAKFLKSGGVFYLKDLVFSFEPSEAEQAIEHWINTVAVSSGAGWSHAELYEHVRNEYSTYSWMLEVMLERAGFEIQEASYSSLKTYASYLCVKV